MITFIKVEIGDMRERSWGMKELSVGGLGIIWWEWIDQQDD
jgi:hypothetical protein